MPTPHNAANKGDIAKNVLMPGDPLRAKFVAENYLTDAVCYNTVRNMFGFTGKYKNTLVSVQGSGMGVPSIGIYSYELYHFYDVERIIRIGSAGGLAEGVKVMNLIAAMGACTNSNYASQYNLPGQFAPVASWRLLSNAADAARALGLDLKVGNVLTSDTFYDESGTAPAWKEMGVLAIEMEAAGLYLNAARAKKEALCLLTISDIVGGHEELSPKDRQEGFHEMVQIALEAVIKE